MEEKEIHNELASIRSLMERSSKFISLSGLSGILAGIYALIGSGVAYHLLYTGTRRDEYHPPYYSASSFMDSVPGDLIITAVIVLFASLITGLVLTKRKARKNNQPIWGSASRTLLFQLSTPLISGGILIMIFICHGYLISTAPISLIFYGLSLIGASSFTFNLVKYLGICEIVLGLIAACLPGCGLLFWAIGFGVLHIVYGSMMYFKYDK